jgi:uncharacterized protein (DUF488 family)
MFYRRKILMALLQLVGSACDRLHLQKLLFLFMQESRQKHYEFVPYTYGCYSFSAESDLKTMEKQGLVTNQRDKKVYQKNGTEDYLAMLVPADRLFLDGICRKYEKMTSDEVMSAVYLQYPQVAVRSVTKDKLFRYNPLALAAIEACKPKITKTTLFTIGYEGVSVENYLNKLLENDIKMLIDVRNKPFSMKWGFCKNQLAYFCEHLGMAYQHFPEVGIESSQRQNLASQKDYDDLFAQYEKETLPRTQQTQKTILQLLKTHKRIALTCFEANPNQCHRKRLADAIAGLPGFSYGREDL